MPSWTNIWVSGLFSFNPRTLFLHYLPPLLWIYGTRGSKTAMPSTPLRCALLHCSIRLHHVHLAFLPPSSLTLCLFIPACPGCKMVALPLPLGRLPFCRWFFL